MVRPHHVSFKHALAGLQYVLKSQPNFRIHLLAAALVLSLAWTLRLPKPDTLILVFTIALVLITEMINTSLEAITDLVTTKTHPYAKIAKDVSAGMVLVAAAASVVVGLIIFLPRLTFLSR